MSSPLSDRDSFESILSDSKIGGGGWYPSEITPSVNSSLKNLWQRPEHVNNFQ